MSSCPPQGQPPDIEELCTDSSRLGRKKPSMSPKRLSQEDLKTLQTSTNNNHANLLRSVSEANVVALCTCQQSKDFPFCDNTHTIFNKATNSNISPLYVAIVEGKCSDCGSKLKDKKDNGLSHSMDHTSGSCNSRGCTLTLSDSSNSPNILNSSDSHSTTACRCKSNKLSTSTPDIFSSLDKPRTRSRSNTLTLTLQTETNPTKSTSTTQTKPTPSPQTSTNTLPQTNTNITPIPPIPTTTDTQPQPQPQQLSDNEDTCNSTTNNPRTPKKGMV